MKILFKIMLVFIYYIIAFQARSQVDTIIDDDGCITVVSNSKMINDSINKPIFKKGNDTLIKTLKKYLLFTNDINCGKKFYWSISFWLELNKYGKIIDSEMITLDKNSKKLKFNGLIKELDYWNPSTLKEDCDITVDYLISFNINIHENNIIISLINENFEIIEEFTLNRPL